jgi:hypothetical protein
VGRLGREEAVGTLKVPPLRDTSYILCSTVVFELALTWK